MGASTTSSSNDFLCAVELERRVSRMRVEAVEAGAWKRVRTSRVLCFVWLVLWGISWGWREGGGGGGVVVRSGTLWSLLYCVGVIGVVNSVGGLFINYLVVMVVVVD